MGTNYSDKAFIASTYKYIHSHRSISYIQTNPKGMSRIKAISIFNLKMLLKATFTVS